MHKREKTHNKNMILAFAIVFLFACAVITSPIAFNLTWALPGGESVRTITYKTGSLTWDSSANITEEGAISISMFAPNYSNVTSATGENVIAPQLSSSTNIRLLNSAENEIEYTAVLYREDDEIDVPLKASLNGATDTSEYTLPAGVSKDKVVGAVGGKSAASSVELMNVNWSWANSDDTTSDLTDTELGNRDESAKVSYGLYVVVNDDGISHDQTKTVSDKTSDVAEDNNSTTTVLPTTGDSLNVLLLFAISIVALCGVAIFAIVDRRRKERAENVG